MELVRFRFFLLIPDEEVSDIMRATLQQMRCENSIADRPPGRGSDTSATARCDSERYRDRYLGFVQIGDIVNEGTLVPRVDESQPWRTTHRHYDAVDYTVQTRICCGKGLIDSIPGGIVCRIIATTVPFETALACASRRDDECVKGLPWA